MKYPKPTDDLRAIINIYFAYYHIKEEVRNKFTTAYQDAALIYPTQAQRIAALKRCASNYIDSVLKNPETPLGAAFAHPEALLSISDILIGNAALENKKITTIQNLQNAVSPDSITTAREFIIRRLRGYIETQGGHIPPSKFWDMEAMIDDLIQEEEQHIKIDWRTSKGKQGANGLSIAQRMVSSEGPFMELPARRNPLATTRAHTRLEQHRPPSHGLTAFHGVPYHSTPLHYTLPLPHLHRAPPPPPSFGHPSYMAGYGAPQPLYYPVPQPYTPPLLQAQNAQHFVVPVQNRNTPETSVWNTEPGRHRQPPRPNEGQPASLQPIGAERKKKAEPVPPYPPSLVLSDVQMPLLPGREAVRFS